MATLVLAGLAIFLFLIFVLSFQGLKLSKGEPLRAEIYCSLEERREDIRTDRLPNLSDTGMRYVPITEILDVKNLKLDVDSTVGKKMRFI